MSKLSDEQLARLERDGLREWLGQNLTEVAKRVEDKDETLHEGMLAELVRGRINLPSGRAAGRPKGTKRPNPKLEAAYADFCQVRDQMRKEGRFYGRHEALVEEIAKRHGVAEDTLRHYIKRGPKAHK